MTEEETAPEVSEEETESKSDTENQEVVKQVMAERKDTKKPKRKVVKSEEPLENFLSAKKVKTTGRKKKAGKLGLEADTQKAILGAIIATGLVVGALGYMGNQKTVAKPNAAPVSCAPPQTAEAPLGPPAAHSDTPSWCRDGL